MKDIFTGNVSVPDEQYTVACVLCNSNRNLVMIPHRDDAKKLVGWVFGCSHCAPFLYKARITIVTEDFMSLNQLEPGRDE